MYLADRYQFVQVNMASSDSTHLTCGLPQGSVLGSIFFSFFLSLCTVQLGQIIDKVGQQFAVDSGQYDSFQHNQVATDVAVQNSESCCGKLKAWMSANMLKLNDHSTDAVLCGSKTQ